MDKDELVKYVRIRTQPDEMDVEAAKKLILEQLHTSYQSILEPISVNQLISSVTINKQSFEKPISITAGYEHQIEDQLVSLRAELAAREAILSLHANGVLIAYGTLISAPNERFDFRNVPLNYNVSPYNNNPEQIGPIYFPSVHYAYCIAALFREDQTIRLASGNIYLSYLNQENLPSRAKRCLREAIEAYKYGLYLSVNMSVGAASESLWMKLSLLLYDKKPSLTNKLGDVLKLTFPRIISVIDETWHVLKSHFDAELKQIFLNNGERGVFKDHANRLCDRRNYAMHREEADEDEPYFTRSETGLLLLSSISYFNQLTKLVATIEKLP